MTIAKMTSLLVVALVLAACETPVEVPTFPDLTYDHLGRLRLDAAKVEVVSEYTSPMAAPHVEHLFPTAPEAALRRWVADRIVAAGRQGTIRFVIVNAGVTETPLPVDTGFTGVFKKQQSERYDAVAEASLEVVDNRGFRRGFASARVKRSRTLGEEATLNERESTWFHLVEGLMVDFDAEMEKNVRQYLGGFLLGS